MHPENNMSQRRVCKLIRASRSTFQSWMHCPAPTHCHILKELEFFSSPEGTICLHRIVLAAAQTIRYGSKEFVEPKSS